MNPLRSQFVSGLTRRIPGALAASLLALTAGAASAQDTFPGLQPVELVVIFPAGSSADVGARILADGMAQNLGTAGPVGNRPGAGGASGRLLKPDSACGYIYDWVPACAGMTIKSSSSAPSPSPTGAFPGGGAAR